MKKLMICAMLSALAFTVAAAGFDRFRTIYPFPRRAVYGEKNFPLPEGVVLYVDDAFSREKFSRFAADLSERLTVRFGAPFRISAGGGAGAPVRILADRALTPELKRRLESGGFRLDRLPPGERRLQSYLLRTLEGGSAPEFIIVSPGEQGAAYAFAALTQLIRHENGIWTIRGADVLDWPGFEMRMGSAAQVGGRDAPRKRQEDSFVLNGLLLRYNYGKSGYPGDTACHTFARDRYLKLCSGYWNRPKGEPPLKPWNWSDPKVNQEYVRLALEYASKPGVGGYFWHDVTDAGWWYSYIDHFWSKRDGLDRKNYPDDPSPARPDAIRFKAMFEALSRQCPGVDVIWTVPVYYDEPQNDGLKDVKNFREYLKLMGTTVPVELKKRFYVMLEERSPETVDAYRHYLGGLKMCQYRYTTLWAGSTWDLNFTEAKRHDGRTEGYFYEASDLIGLMAAQYLWNPDLPTDEKWIVENIAPRAAYELYGPAWREITEYFRLNLNVKTIGKETNAGILAARLADAEKAAKLLDAALAKLPDSWLYARYLAGEQRKRIGEYRKLVEKGLEKSRQSIPLAGAKFTSSVRGIGDLKKAALSGGKAAWSSGRVSGPHRVEIELPGCYSLNRAVVKIPGDGGYAWRNAEIAAEVHGNWKTLAPVRGEHELLAEFDDVRTSRVRLVFRDGWEWAKNVRPDMILSGVYLYGSEVKPDPPGVARLDGLWHFRLDKDRRGMGERWFERTRFPSDEWFRIAVPSRFESSGLPGAANYDGQVWYALSFDTPKGWGGKAVRLRFEAVDDEAEVWLNGKRLGLHTKEGDADTTWWEEPFSFDATAALKPEGANTLVVRVDDFTLDGGIWKSVLLHIGDGPGLYSGK